MGTHPGRIVLLGFGHALGLWLLFVAGFLDGPTEPVAQAVAVGLALVAGHRLARHVGSFWWLYVALQTPMAASLRLLERLDAAPGVLAVPVEVAGLVSFVFVVFYFVVAPLFPFALYLHARAVRRSAAEWNPDPRVYGLAGLAVYGAPVTPRLSLPTTPLPLPTLLEAAATFLALGYLVRRYRAVGLQLDDAVPVPPLRAEG